MEECVRPSGPDENMPLWNVSDDVYSSMRNSYSNPNNDQKFRFTVLARLDRRKVVGSNLDLEPSIITLTWRNCPVVLLNELNIISTRFYIIPGYLQ